jgi:ABC-type sugar transport system permease subunit
VTAQLVEPLKKTGAKPPSAAARRRQSPTARKEARIGLFLILPAALTILIVMIVPIGYAVWASTLDYSIGQESNVTFIFLDNYIRFFQDPVAIQSLIQTVIFTVLDLVLCLAIGIGMAVVLKSLPTRVGNVMRAIYSMPLLISPIIVGLIWRYMYDPNYGIVYWLLSLVGIPSSGFGGLTSPSTALLSVVIADVWNVTPFIMLVVAAGLTTIPEELYEAAKLDGAGALRTLFKVTLPLLAKVITILILIRGTDAFRVFDIIYGLTSGGPANSTTSLSIYAYRAAYQFNEMGYGMAVSVLTLVGLVVLFAPFMRNSARGKDD